MTAPTLTDEQVCDKILSSWDGWPGNFNNLQQGFMLEACCAGYAAGVAAGEARIAELVEWQRLAEAELENYRARIAELERLVADVIERATHEDGCRWWDANISELISPEARAANDARCNCIISECRAATKGET